MTNKELVMYGRSYGCPFMTTAKRVLQKYDVPYREIHIDKDPIAKERVLGWTGFLSVPTLIVANVGEDLPYTDFTPLTKGASPRGIDRGSMLTEASSLQVENWLRKHGFISD
ncbi:MAG: glutaredoxin family protein [Anaerolineae bacterium]|nr:glutaredoxin family protein [Anaerolineae bacterium]